MYKAVVKKAEEESAVQSEVQAASKQALQAKDMKTEYGSTVADRALLPSFLVSQDDAVPFIDAVEAIGSSTGASITISSLSSAIGDSSHKVVTATISMSGAWASVIRSIEIIEDIPYAISIKDLHMDAFSDSSKSSNIQWTAGLDISVLSSL